MVILCHPVRSVHCACALGKMDDAGQEEVCVEKTAVSLEFGTGSFQCHRVL